ncbi:uncharacterized protein LOC136033694 isoform X3 [Artemia franciscana]|uniref:GPI ethanolamine phosphate transferase 3 n=1 Tax=Artemia franciscana TaxID=6661 RepID=A0AA88L9W7_ARTSF|nr:hypothetical protein QYM36_002203 [Artemia franciscana]
MKMFPKRNQSLWLSLVLTCQVALFGIVFFCRGFLLQKLLIPDVNNLPTDHGKPMWDQVVLLIIDALKYDFMSSIGLTEVYAFSEHNTSHSKFYKFVADPPTTTLQRLKSMTTGTLPTFIEAALNFGGSEITEDNIIDQLLRQKSNIIQMGDDTWDSIFPERFLRSYPYPSFDVWDLDTVDRGVERQIFDELKKKDWKLLIAHCLGVDHAGHRYGPNHQEMKRKLKEMDVFVRLVMENLPPNSLLLVFGDHGMTSTGDHGGDTNDEVNAALFAYSNSHPFTNDTNREIPQVDLVPTLSVLFGIPIPFSNIGRVVKGLLPLSPKDKFYSLALYQNIAQVRQYLEKYVSYAPSAMKGLELEKFFFRVDRVKEAPNINEAEKVLKIIQGKFRETCTQFNVYFILIGCFLSAISIYPLIFSKKVTYSNNAASALVIVLSNCCILFLVYNEYFAVLIQIVLVCVMTFVSVYIMEVHSSVCPDNVKFSPLILIFSCFVYFSNSFVIAESVILRFLLSTLIFHRNTLTGKLNLRNLLNTILATVLVQLNQYFEHCREENGPECVNNDLYKPLSSLNSSAYFVLFRLLLALISTSVLLFLTKNSKLFKCLALMVACVNVYWICESFTLLPSSFHSFLPNVVLASFLTCWCCSLNGHVDFQDLIFIIQLTVMLLVGDGLAPSVVSCLLVDKFWNAESESENVNDVIFLVLLSWHGFFSGRNATFSSIQWNAAFIGSFFPGETGISKVLKYVAQGVKVSVATFGFQIIYASVAGYRLPLEQSHFFISATILRLSCSMVSCFILRRHLMTWKIFAPRFIFEGLGTLISMVFCLAGSFLKLVEINRKRRME